MKFIFLTEKFYEDYSQCSEIEKKITRPYAQLLIEIDGLVFAVPLRSNIKHKFVLWSDKENNCGLDFSKAVIVLREEYIDKTNIPYLRPLEFTALKGKEYIAKQKLKKYIKEYKRAKRFPEFEFNKRLCKYSTLQYFEEYLDKIN